MPVIVSKTAIMEHVIAGRAHESFTHSECGTFDVTLMREWAKANLTPVSIRLSDILEHITTTRDYDLARATELSLHDALNDPALVVVLHEQDGDKHLYIDGHHRALCLHANLHKHQLAYFIDEKDIIRPGAGWERPQDIDWGNKVMVDGKLVDRG